MAFDRVIRGRLVLPEGEFDGSVGIEDGRIARVSPHDLEGPLTDARDRMVLPGVVDLHAHFSEPGRTHWEGWAHGSRAAAAGGVTTVVDMPLNAIPATVNREAFELKRSAGEASSIVDFALWGGLVDDNLDELADLMTTGVMGIKAFMVDTKDDTFRFVPEPLLRRGMEKIAVTPLFLAVHAEDNEGTWERTKALKAEGRVDLRAWNEARSVEGELAAITRALRLAAETRCRLHVVHVSIPEGVEALRAARAAGQNVTWETCVHYLTLTDEDFYRLGTEAKCAPPLRDSARREALWDLVLTGQFDCLTSDHSPCPTEDKTDDVWTAWGGINGIQSFLPALITEGRSRGLSWPALAKLTAENPARLAGQAHRKGRIVEGMDADFAIVDSGRPWILRQEQLLSRHPHSPYVGRTMNGWVEETVVRGNTVVRDGVPVVQKGGVFLPFR
jgi:allantoinase